MLDININEITTRTIQGNYRLYFELNVGAIILDNFIIVIDTLLYPSQARKFRGYLKRKYDLPVKYLFITHCHGDHLLGMGEFKDTEVFGTNNLLENMKIRMKENWTKEKVNKWKEEEPDNAEQFDAIDLFLPHWTFTKKHIIQDGDLQVEFYNSGGHTGCSGFAYFPNDKILFTGDELASYNWPFISDPTGNPDSWIKAYEFMLSLDVNLVIPGHGRLVDLDHLKEHYEYLKTLRTIAIKGIENGIKPKDLSVPEFYKPAEDWQIPKALEHLYHFYSKK